MNWKKSLILGMFVLTIYYFMVPSYAMEKTEFPIRNNEIVFLLDTSNSMNTQDENRLAIDGIRQMMYSMPSGSQMGLVAYNTGIQALVPLTENTEQLETQLKEIKYTGYTNAGEGLAQAVALFSGNKNTNKYIIILSDGEIDMKKEEDTLHSKELFSEAMILAKEKEIMTFLTVMGSEIKDKAPIHEAIGSRGGLLYRQVQSDAIGQIMEWIRSEQLNMPMKSVGIMQGKNGAFHIELPSNNADQVKILLTGSNGIDNVNASYTATEGQVTSGQKFAVVHLKRPTGTNVEVTFDAKELSGIKAWLMTEYQAELAVAVEYRSEEIPPPSEVETDWVPEYEHYADLTIKLLDKVKGDNIWSSEYYQGTKVKFYVDDDLCREIIQDGSVRYTLRADDIDKITVSLETDEFYERFYIEETTEINLDIPPDPIPEQEPDYRPLWVVLGGLAIVLFGILALCIKKSRSGMIYVAQPTPVGGAQKCETKACEYTGKLNLYVVQTDSGRDIAPQTFRLFGRKSGRMTLEWVLNTCKVKLGKIGSEEIIFYPGPDKSVIIMDQSERCTVMRGMEILKKGMGYPVFFNEKLTVTFEDGTTEIEIHYKNLKPNEREGSI